MSELETTVEQRVFELLGEYKLAFEIADEIGMDTQDAVPIILKVLRERGTPQAVETRRTIARLGAIRF